MQLSHAILSFFCSLDNFLLKNVIVFFLKIKFQNGPHLKQNGYFDLLFTFLVTREKTQKAPSAHITLTPRLHQAKVVIEFILLF